MANNWIDTKYDAKIKAYRPRRLDSLVTFPSKKEAREFCKEHGFVQTSIDRVGSRFWQAWGIREDPHCRIHTFLAR